METYISQLELMVVLAAMVECASFLRQSRGVWFIDNVSALMALVNGRSNVNSLDQMARFGHIVNFDLGASAFYEWVESDSNGSDEISREGLAGEWAVINGFQLAKCSFHPALLLLPTRAVVALMAFLG